MNVREYDINRVQLLGNVGKDAPQSFMTVNNSQYLTFQLATSESWLDKEQNTVQRTSWHKVVIYAPRLIEFVESNIKPGARVLVMGKLKARSWKPEGSETTNYSYSIDASDIFLKYPASSSDAKQQTSTEDFSKLDDVLPPFAKD